MQIKIIESFTAEVITEYHSNDNFTYKDLYLTAGDVYEVKYVKLNENFNTVEIKFSDNFTAYGIPADKIQSLI